MSERPAAGWSWTDPETCQVNAQGRLTPLQRAMVVTSRKRLLSVATTLLVLWLFMEVAAFRWGVQGAVVLALLTAWWMPVPAVVAVVRRRHHRQMVAGFASKRVTNAVGRITNSDTAVTGSTRIRAPEGTPPLPPPGPYRLYWLERPGILLSVRPVDPDSLDVDRARQLAPTRLTLAEHLFLMAHHDSEIVSRLRWFRRAECDRPSGWAASAPRFTSGCETDCGHTNFRSRTPVTSTRCSPRRTKTTCPIPARVPCSPC
ncbi:hypothetical protein [Actinocrispum wychmicini]|uniref:Uncharacterized protein n=1 Tax=Actinocrispum wychmicini TaxID=1213861 RepID=A0A4R2KGW9_9PSEU|nr:hypothetical protein [Actinocrispum wychmicini]TCO65685.1 hypothetical protein EV192_1011477 [Actinocrispum wychmicini]